MQERVLFRNERRRHPRDQGRILHLEGSVRAVLINAKDTPDFPRLWTDARGAIYREDVGGIRLAWDAQGRDYYSIGSIPRELLPEFGERFKEAKHYAQSLAPRHDDYYARVDKALGPR